MIDNRDEMKAAECDRRCARSRKKRQESVSQRSSSEEQRNQQLKKVVMITQGEGAEFQHAAFYYNRFKEC